MEPTGRIVPSPEFARRHHLAKGSRSKRKRRRLPRTPRQPSLFTIDGFRAYWVSRLLTQTAQGALMYAMLIVVADRTGASFYSSLFVVCAIVPSILFGLPAGIVVDSLPRKPLLVTLNVIRFAFAAALVAERASLAGIFAAALGLWTVHQFYSPAESAALAGIVPRRRYTDAQAMANLALTLAQLVGLVIFAPILLKTVGPRPVFALCGALFIGGAMATTLLPSIDEHLRERRESRGSLRETLFTGWFVSRRDHVVYEVMVDDILVGIGGSALVVITPLYLKGVLDTSAENTVFVFAPAALGLVVGLRLSTWLGHVVGSRRLATAGLMQFAVCIGLLGFVQQIHDLITDLFGFPFDELAHRLYVAPLVLLVMLISIPAGFASSVVSVSARSVLLERTPAALRGQVIATQSLLQNLGALVPTLLAGVAADALGVERVAIAIAMIMAGGAIAALTYYRPVPLSPGT